MEKKRRMTRQRRVIIEEVRNVRTHPTADEVYQMVRERLPKISLGTVYRNLDVLSASGEISRLETSGSQYRFDGNTDSHYHVRCVRCDRVDDLDGVTINVPEALVRQSVDYDIVGHCLELLGVCPKCRCGQEASNA